MGKGKKVTKKQVQKFSLAAWMAVFFVAPFFFGLLDRALMFAVLLVTVSYTHLDVYKRQGVRLMEYITIILILIFLIIVTIKK